MVFSEDVTGFTNTDLTLGGIAGATTAVVTGGPATYNVAVSGMTVDGTVTPSIGAGLASDLAGNTNLASTSTDNTVTYNEPICPCTIWDNATVPGQIDSEDPGDVELGVKFRSSSDGFITGLRFYKGPANTGPHIGNLWTSTGTLLGSATFSNETATGWQQVDLPARSLARPAPMVAITVPSAVMPLTATL